MGASARSLPASVERSGHSVPGKREAPPVGQHARQLSVGPHRLRAYWFDGHNDPGLALVSDVTAVDLLAFQEIEGVRR